MSFWPLGTIHIGAFLLHRIGFDYGIPYRHPEENLVPCCILTSYRICLYGGIRQEILLTCDILWM